MTEVDKNPGGSTSGAFGTVTTATSGSGLEGGTYPPATRPNPPRARKPKAAPEPEHGTAASWLDGCRCRACEKAQPDANIQAAVAQGGAVVKVDTPETSAIGGSPYGEGATSSSGTGYTD